MTDINGFVVLYDDSSGELANQVDAKVAEGYEPVMTGHWRGSLYAVLYRQANCEDAKQPSTVHSAMALDNDWSEPKGDQ